MSNRVLDHVFIELVAIILEALVTTLPQSISGGARHAFAFCNATYMLAGELAAINLSTDLSVSTNWGKIQAKTVNSLRLPSVISKIVPC